MKDHIPDHLYENGSLSFLDASGYEHVNLTIKLFKWMSSMRKMTTIEKAVQLINETSLNEKAVSLFKKGTVNALRRDGMKRVLETVNKTSCLLIEHFTRNGSRALANCIREIFKEQATDANTVAIPANVYLHIVKYGHVKGGPIITLKDYEENKRTIPRNLHFWNLTMRVFADCKFGPTKVKRLGVVVVNGEDVAYRFAHVLLVFHLNVTGTLGSGG